MPWIWELPPTTNVFYPVFSKCVELDIPFCTQVGHTGPLCPSEPGRPIPYIDQVGLTPLFVSSPRHIHVYRWFPVINSRFQIFNLFSISKQRRLNRVSQKINLIEPESNPCQVKGGKLTCMPVNISIFTAQLSDEVQWFWMQRNKIACKFQYLTNFELNF